MIDGWNDEEYVREKAFDILEAWGERFPGMKAYYARATGGVDTFRLIIAADEAFGAALDRMNAIFPNRLPTPPTVAEGE